MSSYVETYPFYAVLIVVVSSMIRIFVVCRGILGLLTDDTVISPRTFPSAFRMVDDFCQTVESYNQKIALYNALNSAKSTDNPNAHIFLHFSASKFETLASILL